MMHTVEFKLDLNQSQICKIDNWLSVQRWVWNHGLNLLENFDKFNHWDKHSKIWVPCCPLPWEYYKDTEGQLIPFTRLAQKKPYRMSCPILQDYRQPELESPSFFGILYHFAKKNHADKPWFCEVPCKFVAGTLQSLTDAWSEYKAGKHKRPKYKRYGNKFKSLVNNNAKAIKVSGKQISLPKLGKVKVKTLDKRWDSSIAIATLKIVREPSGYYLQLTGELPTKQLKPSNKAVGLGLGYKHLFITDGGRAIEPPAHYQKIEKRIQRLQRKLSRQQNLCPISTYNPELGEHFLSCPINPHKGANKQKTQQKVARQHEKLRRTRKAFNHKLSTKLVREYSRIAIAKSDRRKITRRPKSIVNKQGTGYDPNGAGLKSQFNKMILTNGQGQLTAMIEQKAVVNGRTYIEVAPKDIPDEPRQRTEHYSKRLRLPRAVHLSTFQQGSYRPWGWQVTLGESPVTLNQEAAMVAPLRDAGTTSNSTSETTNHNRLVDIPESTSALKVSKQPQKAHKHKDDQPNLNNQSGKKKRRSTKANNSG